MKFYYELFPCLLVIIKDILKCVLGKYTNIISIIAMPITILFLIIGSLFVVPWLFSYVLVKTYLNIRYRHKFGGLLNLNTLIEHGKASLTVVYIVKHDGTHQELVANIKQCCKNLMNSHYRFSSRVSKCFGYYYFLKDEVAIDDVISTVDECYSTKAKLLDYLEENCFRRIDGTVKLWNVKIFKHPITWCDDNNTYYSIVITYNHCLADGICLAVFQQKYLLEDVIQEKFENALNKAKRPKSNFQKSGIIPLGLAATKANCSSLISSKNTFPNLVLYVEEKPNYLELIQKLSKCLQCTFTDIILTASVASAIDYLETKSMIPQVIMAGNTCRPLTEISSKMLNAEIFDNEMTTDLFDFHSVETNSILEKFLEWRKMLSSERNSAISQIFYLCRRIMSFLPASILLHGTQFVSKHVTLGITNIPGADFAKFGKAVVKDSFQFVNHCHGVKLIMTVHSYAGRLQVSLMSERCTIVTREELQDILDNTFKIIDNLWEEYKASLQQSAN